MSLGRRRLRMRCRRCSRYGDFAPDYERPPSHEKAKPRADPMTARVRMIGRATRRQLLANLYSMVNFLPASQALRNPRPVVKCGQSRGGRRTVAADEGFRLAHGREGLVERHSPGPRQNGPVRKIRPDGIGDAIAAAAQLTAFILTAIRSGPDWLQSGGVKLAGGRQIMGRHGESLSRRFAEVQRGSPGQREAVRPSAAGSARRGYRTSGSNGSLEPDQMVS